MATAYPPTPESPPSPAPHPAEIKLYSHSSFFYLWPIWAFGFLFAAMTYFAGETVDMGPGGTQLFYPTKSIGLVYVMVIFLVATITNMTVRGVWSLVVLLVGAFLTVLLAWLDLWAPILSLVPRLSVHMNFGFYMMISTLTFIVWGLSFFVYDRLTFYRVRPGQLVEEHVIGGGEKSYDTRGMVVEQVGEDLFRHWILGFGSGDLKVVTFGGQKHEIYLPNVLFADRRVKQLQKLASMENEAGAPT